MFNKVNLMNLTTVNKTDNPNLMKYKNVLYFNDIVIKNNKIYWYKEFGLLPAFLIISSVSSAFFSLKLSKSSSSLRNFFRTISDSLCAEISSACKPNKMSQWIRDFIQL